MRRTWKRKTEDRKERDDDRDAFIWQEFGA